MNIWIHPHAKGRMVERDATEEEVKKTIRNGERFPAQLGRTGFRYNFSYNRLRRGKKYSLKQIEVYAVEERNQWTVITVITRFF